MSKRSVSLVVAFAVLGAVGFEVAAVAQDSASSAKRTKKPTQVDVVQSVPLEVVASGAPLPVAVSSLPTVAIGTLPAVDVATLPGVVVSSMPSVTVASLPNVTIASLPNVTIANSPLNVNVVNSSLTTSPATNATVIVSDLNGATLSSNFTSTHVIDCAGYSKISVFLSHDPTTSGGATFALEFLCGGVSAWVGSDNGSFGIPPTSTRGLIETSEVLGPQLRIRAFTTVTVTNVKVVVYLRR